MRPYNPTAKILRTRVNTLASCSWQQGAWSNWNSSAGTVLQNNQCVQILIPPTCPEDQYPNSLGQCVEFQCNRFEALETEPMVVPARTISNGSTGGVCYYKKIFNPIASSPSSLTGVRFPNVMAHGHDQWMINNNNPFLMGSKDFLLTLQGKRSVKLSSAPTMITQAIVDNFILVRFNNDQQVFAYGSADSAVLGTQYISFNGRPIALDSSGFSGVHFTIKPLDFTIQFPVNIQKSFSIQALDCGTIRELSDVYMIFQ